MIVNLKEIFKIRQMEKQIGKKFSLVKIPTGREVCEKQLYHLVDKVKNIEVQHEEIGTFLPTVYEKLKGISKEEIIQRFVSAEFNRFLSYYRNAPDINVDLKRREEKPATARLFVNVGQMERFTPKSLRAYLLQTADMANLRILNVDVMKSCSFFETDTPLAEPLIAAFRKVKFSHRRVQIEYADRRVHKEKGNKDHTSRPRNFSASVNKKRRF